ncbi:hypothetical protein [Desulfatirhabdium butyrativorans]|uniref:hypothetical protein n=1 Tax=Desulfatirhabdium butyrativorans TaxID=340467 RepID=UPI0012EBE776|nr:hypothetical protein [Desulfatirhabdium butyrativorans]
MPSLQAKQLTPEMLHRLDVILEDFYPKSRETGEKLAQIRMEKSQVRGLENMVVSTSRFSEILNFIKNQAGKERKDNKWRKAAEQMLTQLGQLEEAAANLVPDDPGRRLEVKMRLARGWIRQLVPAYLFYGKVMTEDSQ